MLGVGCLLALVLGVGVVSLPGLLGALANGRDARSALENLRRNFSKYDFSAARVDALRARQAFERTDRSIGALVFWRTLPVLGTQYRAVQTLADTGVELSTALTNMVDVGERIFTPIKDRPNLSLASLSVGERAAVLAAFGETGPVLASAEIQISHAEAIFSGVPRRGLLPPVRAVIEQVDTILPPLADGVRAAIPATKLLPPLIGFPDPVTYLFLLENNTELRPTGGFIGTYGLVTVKDGDVQSFTTDNVYNLDDRVKGTRATPPPIPLTRYNKVGVWYLRDSNWSPDFPTSAAQALRFYREEGGSGKPEGVIAVTPTVIGSLLELTGPITVGGLTFTSQNFVETLQDQVDRGFLRAGLPASQRKEVIGELSRILMDRLQHLPQSRWGKLWEVINHQLKAKQLLFYHTNPNLESKILEEGWGGQLAPTGGDSIALVDANLASLKSDPGVQRTLDYRMLQDPNGPISELNVTYHNTGTFTWKTTRYRTYLRVYVPPGSVLLDSSGADRRDRSDAPGTVDTTDELGFSVFGAFKSIEPGSTESIRFRWRMAPAVAERMRNGYYSFTVFKQAGTDPQNVSVDLDFPRSAKATSTPYGVDIPSGSRVRWSVPLTQDLVATFRL